jgi:hypothetical protein
MSLLDSILNAQGGAVVQQLGSQFGLGSDQTTAALGALVPALAAGVQQNTQTSAGMTGLLNALTGGDHQKYVNDPSTLADPSTTDDGNGILGHLFGSKDVSRQVATHAAGQTGVSADVLRQMLPVAATLVMGAMANHARSGAAAGGGSGAMASMGGSALSNILNATLSGGSGQGAMAQGMAGLIGGLLRG